MTKISVQVSLYPLRRESIGPPIREAVRHFREQGLEVRVGEMSTLIWGEERKIFEALQEVFRRTADQGDVVMNVTFSNACPEPSDSPEA